MEVVPKKKTKGQLVEAFAVLEEHMPAEVRGKWAMANIEKVKPNDYNYNKMAGFMFDKLVASMRKLGWSGPAVVVRTGNQDGPFDDDTYTIIDGEHRYRAALEVGLTEIPIQNLGNVPDDIAKTMTITFNELHGKADHDQLAQLVAHIGDTDQSLLELLPYDERELDSFRTSGAADLAALEQLGTDEASLEGEDDEEGEEGASLEHDVAAFLGLYDMTPEEHRAMQSRLEKAQKQLQIKNPQPGQLLDKIISAALGVSTEEEEESPDEDEEQESDQSFEDDEVSDEEEEEKPKKARRKKG